jgi:hypothetical protein
MLMLITHYAMGKMREPEPVVTDESGAAASATVGSEVSEGLFRAGSA